MDALCELYLQRHTDRNYHSNSSDIPGNQDDLSLWSRDRSREALSDFQLSSIFPNPLNKEHKWYSYSRNHREKHELTASETYSSYRQRSFIHHIINTLTGTFDSNPRTRSRRLWCRICLTSSSVPVLSLLRVDVMFCPCILQITNSHTHTHIHN